MFARKLNPGLELRPLQPADAPALFAVVDAHRASLREWLPWVDATKTAAAGEDADDIEAKAGSLTDVLHRLSEQVYQQAAAQQQATADGTMPEETVEDAEYEVIDEDATKAS